MATNRRKMVNNQNQANQHELFTAYPMSISNLTWLTCSKLNRNILIWLSSDRLPEWCLDDVAIIPINKKFIRIVHFRTCENRWNYGFVSNHSSVSFVIASSQFNNIVFFGVFLLFFSDVRCLVFLFPLPFESIQMSGRQEWILPSILLFHESFSTFWSTLRSAALFQWVRQKRALGLFFYFS